MLRFLTILLILLAATFAFATEQKMYPNQDFFSVGTPVIDLTGGITHMQKIGIPLVPSTPDRCDMLRYRNISTRVR